MFDSIIGHAPLKEYLRKALLELPTTLLFAGPEGVGKRTFALELAAHLLGTGRSRLEQGNCVDFHLLAPEGKSGLHSIDAIREAIGAARESPLEAPVQIFLLEAVDRMQPAAANALLKTLEEPPPRTHWILITSAPEKLLATILSRCAKLFFQPLAEKEVAQILQKQGHPPEWARFGQGSVSTALELHLSPSWIEVRQTLFSLLRERMSYTHLMAKLEQIEKLLEDEDPLAYQRKVAQVFTLIAFYFRDQILRQIDAASSHLFFSEEKGALPPPKWVADLQTARIAFERNIKLSSCLESLLA